MSTTVSCRSHDSLRDFRGGEGIFVLFRVKLLHPQRSFSTLLHFEGGDWNSCMLRVRARHRVQDVVASASRPTHPLLRLFLPLPIAPTDCLLMPGNCMPANGWWSIVVVALRTSSNRFWCTTGVPCLPEAINVFYGTFRNTWSQCCSASAMTPKDWSSGL